MLIKNFLYRILAIIGAVCFGLSLTGILMTLYNADYLKVSQTLQMIFVFALPALFCAMIFSEKPFSFLYLQKTSAKNCFFAVLFAFSALPVINFFGWLNAQIRLPEFLSSLENWMRTMEDKLMRLSEQMLAADTLGGLAANLVVIALLAAICEELFFRGLLQKTLTERINKHAAIWLSAVIFSVIHLQFYGFLPRMLLGAAFGYMAMWSGSLWLPILAHFINNAIAVIAFFITEKQNLTIDIDNIGIKQTWYYGLLFLPFCIYFMVKMKDRTISKLDF